MAKPPIFNGEASRVRGFIMVYKLFLKIKIRRATVEKQIQWVLLYVQRELVDIQEENLLENLKSEKVKFGLVEEFCQN